jgi:hypothetical protein
MGSSDQDKLTLVTCSLELSLNQIVWYRTYVCYILGLISSANIDSIGSVLIWNNYNVMRSN